MYDYQNFMAIGRVGDVPKLRHVGKREVALCTFALCVNVLGRKYGEWAVENSDAVMRKAMSRIRAVKKPKRFVGKTYSTWFRVEVWDRVGERVFEQVEKGSRVMVSGGFSGYTWKDVMGQSRYSLAIRAWRVERIDVTKLRKVKDPHDEEMELPESDDGGEGRGAGGVAADVDEDGDDGHQIPTSVPADEGAVGDTWEKEARD